MNGTIINYLKHGALAAAITGLCALFGHPIWGAIVATTYFWAKEIGEKCVKWDAPDRPWSDLWPLHPRWSKDDRLDLLSAIVAAWALAVGLVL